MPTKSKSKPDPILDDAPTVEIAGHTYPLRRLGLRDVFRVARIFGNGVHVLGDAAAYSPGQVVQVLVASVARAEEEVLQLIASLIGLDRADLDDVERFPMESIVDVFEVLSESQDLAVFLARVEALMSKSPEMQTASREASNS